MQGALAATTDKLTPITDKLTATTAKRVSILASAMVYAKHTVS